jgi:hypothetical protein
MTTRLTKVQAPTLQSGINLTLGKTGYLPLRKTRDTFLLSESGMKVGRQHCSDWATTLQMMLHNLSHLLWGNPTIPNVIGQDTNHRSIATLPHAACFGKGITWSWMCLKCG